MGSHDREVGSREHGDGIKRPMYIIYMDVHVIAAMFSVKYVHTW